MNLVRSKQGERDLAHALQHLFDGLTACPGITQSVNRCARRDCHFAPVEVCLDPGGLPQNAGIEDERLASEIVDAIPEISGFWPFGVQRTDQQNGCHSAACDGWTQAPLARRCLMVRSQCRVYSASLIRSLP